MNMTRRVFVSALTLLLIAASCAWALSAPEGFAGIKWQSYFHELEYRKDMKEYGRSGERLKVYTREGDNIALNNFHPKQVYYNFLDGRFSGANMVFIPADKEGVIDALARLYGPCKKINEYTYLWEFSVKGELFPFIVRGEIVEIRDGSKVFNVGYSTPGESEYISSL